MLQGKIEEFVYTYGIVPAHLLTLRIDELKTLITAMFLHGSWVHFLGNMLYLHIFADNVEDRFGHIRFLFIYLICGISASIIHILSSPYSKIPMIGASGAIAGVLGAYFVLFPHARILTFVPFGLFTRIVYVPAFFFLGIWFIIQLHHGTLSILGPYYRGVAWWAHVGGFLTGVVFGYFRKKRW